MPNPIRVAVIGAGAFGRNHLRVLHDLSQASPNPSLLETSPLAPQQNPQQPSGASKLQNSKLKTQPNPQKPSEVSTSEPQNSKLKTQPNPHPIQLTAVVDAHPNTRTEAASRYGIPAFASVDDLFAADLGLQAATVCVPTLAHAAVAAQLLEANLDVLVEKPLTATLAEADILIRLAQTRDRILAAGHLERFNPAVTAAFTRLTTPMFFEAHRLSVFTPRSLDVDVVLDLMIHDLDILLTMAQSPVHEVRAVGLPVLSSKVDIANVRLEFKSGAVANLTASRVSTEQIRKLRLFQPAQYLSLDYARQELLTINVDANSGSAHPSPGLSFNKLDLPRAEPLRLELEDFLTAVATRAFPRVTAPAARAALALALEINTVMAAHTKRTGLKASPQDLA